MDSPGVGVGVIIRKGSKVLLGKRKSSHGAGTWQFPGGHLELNESWEDCAKREVKEEVNIEIENINFAAATNDIFKKEGKHYITVFMVADYASGNFKLMEPDKCEEWQWFDWASWPRPSFLPVENLLKQDYNPFKINENK